MADCNNPRNPFVGSGRKKEGGFLALHKQDFNAHISGTAYRHCADQIDMNPELEGCGAGTNVQEVLETILTCLGSAVSVPIVEPIVTTGPFLIVDETTAVHRIFTVDVTLGTIDISLPTNPFHGETITIKHWSGDVASENIVIKSNGSVIDDVEVEDVISNSRDAKTYQYDNGLGSWILR